MRQGVFRSAVLRPVVLLAALLGVLAAAGPGQARTWEEPIADAQRRAAEYNRAADARGAPVFLGTGSNNLDVPMHTCSILGKLLDRSQFVGHLEREYPPLSIAEGDWLRGAALSLSNWVSIARQLLETDRPRRVEMWNLDCVGQHSIPAAAYIGQRAAAFFDVFGDSTIRILGEVTPGFADRLGKALQANPRVTVVALGSGGGSVLDAIAAGRLIRQKGLKTTLWNGCYSACSLVFLGGTFRGITSPYPKLGFHMASVGGKAIPANHAIYGEIAAYAREMGVDDAAVIRAMMSATPQDMHYPKLEDMCRARIASWIQRIC